MLYQTVTSAMLVLSLLVRRPLWWSEKGGALVRYCEHSHQSLGDPSTETMVGVRHGKAKRRRRGGESARAKERRLETKTERGMSRSLRGSSKTGHSLCRRQAPSMIRIETLAILFSRLNKRPGLVSLSTICDNRLTTSISHTSITHSVTHKMRTFRGHSVYTSALGDPFHTSWSSLMKSPQTRHVGAPVDKATRLP